MITPIDDDDRYEDDRYEDDRYDELIDGLIRNIIVISDNDDNDNHHDNDNEVIYMTVNFLK